MYHSLWFKDQSFEQRPVDKIQFGLISAIEGFLADEGEDIHDHSIKNLFTPAGHDTWETSTIEIIIHLAALLFSRENDGLVGPLFSLAVNPAACAVSTIKDLGR